MSFPGEKRDLYAERATGMTAAINEKKEKRKKKARTVPVSHYRNVRSLLLPLM